MRGECPARRIERFCNRILASDPVCRRPNMQQGVRIASGFAQWVWVTLLAGALFFAGSAQAANTINSVTVDGAASTTVAPGASISVAVTNTTSGGTDWGSTRWYIGASAPGSWNCDASPTPTIASNGTNTATLAGPITAPTTPGTYNAYFSTSSSNSSCSNNLSATFTLPNSVVVAAIAPAVTTDAASSVTATGATLNATVTSNGASTAVTFDYGLTTAYGANVTATGSPLTASAFDTAVSKTVTGLICNTRYHFRVKGVNAVGTANGSDATFTTSACVPTATTSPATLVTASGATLNGTVSSNGASTAVTFDYGLTAAYGSSVVATASPLAAGASASAVSAALAGLASNTTYHFRVRGANSAGTTNGSDLTFTTANFCSPPPNIPSGVTVSCQCDVFGRASLNPSTIFGANWVVSKSDSTAVVPYINGGTGLLRLTEATGSNAKAATVPGIFPAAGNYISVEFQQYAYGGNGADGIAVTLSDYSVPAVPGAFGGSLGFAQKSNPGSDCTTPGGCPGFAGGWLGVALDEYGNYSAATEGRVLGAGASAQSVGVRGPGTGQNGYRWMGGALGVGNVANSASSSPAPGNMYQIVVDARDSINKKILVYVNRDTSAQDGTNYANLFGGADGFNAYTEAKYALDQNWISALIPKNWQISFTGSTGGANNIHEIGSLRICAQSIVPPSGGAAGSFNAIDDAYGMPPSVAVQNYLAGHIYAKLVGTPFKLNVAALSNSQVLTTYAASSSKTVTVKLVDNSDGLTDATKDCTQSCTATCTGKAAVSNGTQTLTFASGAADSGQKQSPNFTINSAYQKLVAIISDGTTTACSTDSFSVRPLSIASVASGNAINTGTSGTPVFKAGSDQFSLTATTTGVAGSPSGYAGLIAIDNAAVLAIGTGAVAGAVSGTFSAAIPDTPSSSATGAAFTYSEVGLFSLLGYDPTTLADATKTRGAYDDTWTNVDQGTKNDCVVGSYSNVKDANGKFGCNFGLLPNTTKFGRFAPDHFALLPGASVGQFCSSATKNFSYMGQPTLDIVYTLEARNSASVKTSNYDAGLSSVTAPVLVAEDQASINQGCDLASRISGVAAASWTAGTYAVKATAAPYATFSRPATPVALDATTAATCSATQTNAGGPFWLLDIGVKMIDADGGVITEVLPLPILPTLPPPALDMNASTTGTCSGSGCNAHRIGTTGALYGRLQLGNAYGSELLDLPVPLEAQFWNPGGSWATNRYDGCTTLPPSAISMSAYTQNLAACETRFSPTGAVTLSSGKAPLVLTRPGVDTVAVPPVPNTGSVLLILNIGSAAVAGAKTCLSATESSATFADLPWFGSTNPAGKATFGAFKTPLIYRRENY